MEYSKGWKIESLTLFWIGFFKAAGWMGDGEVKTTPSPTYFWKYTSWIYEIWHRHTPNYAVSKTKKITDPTLLKNADIINFLMMSVKIMVNGLIFVFSAESVRIIVRKQLAPHLKDIET